MANVDPDSLAEAVGGESAEAEKAWAELQPYVEKIAKEIVGSRRSAKQVTQDFLDRALAHVWEALQENRFDRNRGRFSGWCRQVLRNLLTDLVRRAKTARNRAILHSDYSDSEQPLAEMVEDDGPDVSQLLEQREPFSRRQLDRLRKKCSARVCVILMLLVGLFWRVPSDIWQNWLKEAGIGEPLPMERMWEREHPLSRGASVALALGMTDEAVRQTWYRYRKHLLVVLE